MKTILWQLCFKNFLILQQKGVTRFPSNIIYHKIDSTFEIVFDFQVT